MKHSMATYTQNKITLCPFEDKRYLLDAINSLPYCHDLEEILWVPNFLLLYLSNMLSTIGVKELRFYT